MLKHKNAIRIRARGSEGTPDSMNTRLVKRTSKWKTWMRQPLLNCAVLVNLCRCSIMNAMNQQWRARALEWQCRFPDTCSLQFAERPRVIQRNAVSSALFPTFNSVDCSYRTEKNIVHVFFFFFFFFCEINRVSQMELLGHCVETSVSFQRIRFSVGQRSWKLWNRLSRNGNAKRTNSRVDLAKYRGNRLRLLG